MHAAILGYLKNSGVPSRATEPWMYEALALALKMNNGPDADVKKALDYAADLAQRTHNPNHLVSVADRLFLKASTSASARCSTRPCPRSRTGSIRS